MLPPELSSPIRVIIEACAALDKKVAVADLGAASVPLGRPGAEDHQSDGEWIGPPDQDLAIRVFTTSPPAGLRLQGSFSLLYVYSGTAAFREAAGDAELAAGDAVFFGPHVRYDIVPGGADSCVVSFVIRPRVVNMSAGLLHPETGVFADYFLRYFYGTRPDGAVHLPRHEDLAGKVRQRVEVIVEDLWQRQSRWNLLASAELVSLLVLLARGYQATVPMEAEAPTPLARILGRIRATYSDVTLGKLAEEFNYSPTHLSRLLQRHTGRRFAELKRELKISHAMSYLQTTDLGLEQISELVGFGSASYLAQVFRAEVGMTPGEFRTSTRHAAPLEQTFGGTTPPPTP